MEELEEVIKAYESGRINYEQTKADIFSLTGKVVPQYSLDHYWRSEGLSDFMKKLLIPSIADWQEINDTRALVLLEEITMNVANAAILERNGEALEKRYGKATGTIRNYIFQEDICDLLQLLEKLKQSTVIQL